MSLNEQTDDLIERREKELYGKLVEESPPTAVDRFIKGGKALERKDAWVATDERAGV